MAGMICVEIGLLLGLYRYVIEKYDRTSRLDWREKWMDLLGAGCILAGGVIGLGMKRWDMTGQLACGILAAYLLIGSVTDLQTYEVYDFLPVVTAAAGAGLLWLSGDWRPKGSLLVYFFIQIVLFRRMYGKADVYAFLVCALFESRFVDGLITYLWHMALTFLLLAAVQAGKGNIDRRGNLKRPVALMPYIAVTVWCFL